MVDSSTDRDAERLQMNKPLPRELIEELEVLEEEDIRRVVVYARSLKEQQERQTNRAEMMKLAGSIPKDEIAQIRASIEEGCERIDHQGW